MCPVIYVYGDDGADANKERVIAVSVIAGREEWWQSVEDQWVVRCGAIPFHATDCESNHGREAKQTSRQSREGRAMRNLPRSAESDATLETLVAIWTFMIEQWNPGTDIRGHSQVRRTEASHKAVVHPLPSDSSSNLCGREDFGNGDHDASCPAPSQILAR
jgi:hypothetical protein